MGPRRYVLGTVARRVIRIHVGMPSLVIDSFASAAPWSAEDPGGAASAEITLTAVTDSNAPVGTANSMRIAVTAAGAGHRIERSFGPIDLTQFSELRWWTRCDSAADGGPSTPMRLRVELGSAAMPVAAVGNTWHRLVPVIRRDTWELIRVALDDLDPLVAAAANTIRFTVIDHTAIGLDSSMTAWLDELMACEPRLVADITDALIDVLDGTLVLAGPVPAELFVPGTAEPPAPWIKVVIDDVGFCDRRTIITGTKTNFVDTGFRIRSEAAAYDIRYRIEPVAVDADDYLQMVEFIVATLAHRRTLISNGVEHALERLPATRRDQRRDAPVLRYVAAAYTDIAADQVFVPVAELQLATEVAQP